MAHVSLQADDCRVYIKNGKLRFQAIRHDAGGEILDQVTISFPIALSGKFVMPQNTGHGTTEELGDIHVFLNRIEGFIREDNPE